MLGVSRCKMRHLMSFRVEFGRIVARFGRLAMSTKVDCSLRASITTFALNSGVSFLRVVRVFIASANLQNLFDLCTGSKKWEYYRH